MDIIWDSPSLLLDHLLVPVSAELTQLDSFERLAEDHLPTSLDNPRNTSDNSNIRAHFKVGRYYTHGTSWTEREILYSLQVDTACVGPEFLAQLDTSKIERLEVVSGDHPSKDPSVPHTSLLEEPSDPRTFPMQKPVHILGCVAP